MVEAIKAGYPQREVADAAYRFQREFDSGERVIVGVNRFADPDEELAIPLLEVSKASLQAQMTRLQRLRRDRDASAVKTAPAGLRATHARPGTSDSKLLPHFLGSAHDL